jgi:uncharacterized integral membrane protein (TIGR00697 family)
VSAVLPILFGLFCASVVVTNAVSAHQVYVGPFVVVAGALLYPVTFLLTDVLSEVYGKRIATRAVWTGFACQVLTVAFVYLVALLPARDQSMAQAWREVFLPMARIAAASMLGYLASQHVDVRLFHAVRSRTGAKWLWLRNNVATSAAQAIDTVIFIVVAFAGILPARVLAQLVIGQYLVKVALAALDTPVCYLAVWYVRRVEGRADEPRTC